MFIFNFVNFLEDKYYVHYVRLLQNQMHTKNKCVAAALRHGILSLISVALQTFTCSTWTEVQKCPR